MDGFAVIASDLTGAPVELAVIEDVPAGTVPTMDVRSGTAIRIMTGAPMPAGADAVAQVEITSMVDGGTVQMWARLGYGPDVGPAPRWPLEEKIA